MAASPMARAKLPVSLPSVSDKSSLSANDPKPDICGDSSFSVPCWTDTTLLNEDGSYHRIRVTVVTTCRPSPAPGTFRFAPRCLELKPPLRIGLEELLLLVRRNSQVIHPADFIRQILIRIVHGKHHTILAHHLDRCCQSNGNLSPIGGVHPTRASVQAISNCHSARAVERRVL